MNNLMYFKQRISGELPKEEIENLLKIMLEEIENIYSYTIISDRNETLTYVIRYSVSDYEPYNTLKRDKVISDILDSIELDKNSNKKYIIGYGQPSIDLLIEIYEPLVEKLAREQLRRWQKMEYEDLCQMCRLTMIILYNKGYFIHKRLLQTAFNNMVLQEVRLLPNDFEIVSLQQRIENGDADMEKISVIDTLQDKEEDERIQDEESIEISKLIFNDVKKIIIDEIGERQFEQLYRDYANKHTSNASRRRMVTLKYKFEKEGLTRKIFNNKYGN